MTSAELWPLVGLPLLIFLARAADVTLGTVRIILISRGHSRVAPLVGFVEILIWLVALTQVMQHLDRPVNYVAFAAGFATGTWVGIYVEGKIALGLVAVRAITTDDARGLIDALSEARFGVTSFAATGVQGRVRLIFTVIPRRELPRVIELIRVTQPKAFISVSDVRQASEGYLPPHRSMLGMFQRKGK